MMTKAWLADPAAILPVFGKPGLLFPVDGMEINPAAEEWRVLIADGTLTLTNPTPEAEAPPAPAATRKAMKE